MVGAKIYNSNLTKELIDGARLQVSQGNIPGELAEKVVPTMETNPRLLKYTSFGITNAPSASSASTLAIVPASANAGKDFYITSLSLSITKTATCDVAQSVKGISATISGQVVSLLSVAMETLTASSQQASIAYSVPVKIDRGTAINSQVFSFTAGTALRSWTVCGYYEDNVTA